MGKTRVVVVGSDGNHVWTFPGSERELRGEAEDGHAPVHLVNPALPAADFLGKVAPGSDPKATLELRWDGKKPVLAGKSWKVSVWTRGAVATPVAGVKEDSGADDEDDDDDDVIEDDDE